MAKSKAYGVTIRVTPNASSQTLQVVAHGKVGKFLLLGRVRRKAFNQPLIVASTEVLQVSEVLTQAQALVLS